MRKALKKEKPDVVLIAGDLVMNGPEPARHRRRASARWSATGAIVVQGNTDIAVADADYAAAFPWMLESGVPDAIRAAAEWAHDALDDEQLGWLRRLPAERRIRIGDDLVLVTHASPGSQTQGFDQDLDPSTVLERISRTDARVICCGHTHIPEVRSSAGRSSSTTAARATPSTATRRPRGRSSRSVRRRRRRDRSATEVMTDGEDDDDDGRRAPSRARTRHHRHAPRSAAPSTTSSPTANAISARGLPGDVYRAATVRTGKLVR